jgi:hypothetical protein
LVGSRRAELCLTPSTERDQAMRRMIDSHALSLFQELGSVRRRQQFDFLDKGGLLG